MNLKGKIAVITGASRGVGRSTTLRLAKAGCSVLVNYSHSEKEAENVAASARALGVDAFPFQGDVSSDAVCRSMMDAAVKRWGRLDILVNNAATTEFIPHSELERFDEAHWDRILNVNVKGAFFCARAASRHMLAGEGGAIINVTSVAGINATGSSIAYCASKAALINMTMSLARVLAPKIRVNSVAPGFIASDWTKSGLGESYETTKHAKAKNAALGRVCEPDDVADVIVSMIAGADMVTGQTIVVDGGALIGPKP